MTTILKFKCELLSDVILNQKAASEGPNKTLDFIPGSCFLGIVAGQLYPKPTVQDGKNVYDPEARLMFHSNEVRFGDAHPANGLDRTLRIPASLYFAKGEKEDGRTHYVHHAITSDIINTILASKIQLKQERSGFVDFVESPALRLKQQTNFAIKSAYDADKRRSKDSQMFGYQSLDKGGVFYFSVEIDDTMKDAADKIKNALMGTRHIGRSRSAQYGLVKITACEDYREVESGKPTDNGEVVVYAESRLIFLDEYGIPTFQPTVEQLLGKPVSDMEIKWDRSQIRTFKYAPYNYARKCFDTDRCGIEKGSVFVLAPKPETSSCKIDSFSRWIGSYQNEGFGKVIFNPPFLSANEENAKLTYKIMPAVQPDSKVKIANPGTTLTKYVLARKLRDKQVGEIYQVANEWVSTNGKAFQSGTFASQWGQIRSIAMKCTKKEDLIKELFVFNESSKLGGYLVHGVAKEKWESNIKALQEFVNMYTPEHVVNLASIMQKKCSENKGGQKK